MAFGHGESGPRAFGPREGARTCPACRAAIPSTTATACPVCLAPVSSAGDPGQALVEAMTDLLGDRLGRRRAKAARRGG
jgi:predicted amidophosphoribosyltransferase